MRKREGGKKDDIKKKRENVKKERLEFKMPNRIKKIEIILIEINSKKLNLPVSHEYNGLFTNNRIRFGSGVGAPQMFIRF